MSASMDSHEATATGSPDTDGQPAAEQQPAVEPSARDVPHEPGGRPTPLSRLLYP
ncbi:hypothetical protein ACIPW9_36015 [Streptomyces sp. NPDC090052]|uniref:hypothetical protein n=1 Tax=Streptomyces sp. NPDC090052 TaxID=3365931 RepID=UPI0038224145